VALSAPTADHMTARKVERIVDVYATSTIPRNTPRARDDIARFFTGLDIVPPCDGAPAGLTHAGLWGCEDTDAADSDGSRWFYVAVARKPEVP
jgi:S-adenosyl methyltransferase